MLAPAAHRVLDRGAAGAGKQLFVYRVKNLEAQVLAGYLSELFGGGGGQTTSRRSQGTLAPGLEPATVGSVQQFNENRLGSSDQRNRDTAGTGGAAIAMGDSEVRITSIMETNSLLIQATQSEYNAVLAAIERIDIAIVPGVALDEKGGRIGSGEGFYDRLIPKLPVTTRKVSLAFECQIVQQVPMESHDKYVDIIITEKRIIYKI